MMYDPDNDPNQIKLDLFAGERLKAEGMAQAAMPRPELLELCRDTARNMLCNGWPDVTTDEVRAKLNLGKGTANSQNWMGSMFRHPDFEATGEFRKSQIPSNHAHSNRVWRLKR
tara:strand:- start:275 stop:616 length:342 start_codon:yes stop_codon:yes gene_type:complete